MKKKLFFLIVILVANVNLVCAQAIIAIPKNNSITITKTKEVEINVPIEIEFINNSKIDQTKIITIQLENIQADPIKQMDSSTEMPLIKVINNNQLLEFKKDEIRKTISGFYISFEKSLTVYSDKIIYLKIISEGNILNRIQINIDPSNISLNDYFNNAHDIKLDEVTKVESLDNVLTVAGFKKDRTTNKDYFLKRKIILAKGEVYTIKEASFWFYKPSISLITVPFKIRPERDSFKTTASSGFTNIGLNMDFFGWKRERYFSSGKKSTKRYGVGIWAAPSVEELDNIYTNNFLPKDIKSKQLFISTGFTLSYSYNDLSFVFVPAGYDIGTSSTGKNWVYNNKRWWGFGLAISPKFFATVLNK